MSDDIQFQIECVSKELVLMLMREYGWDMKKTLDQFYSSETFRNLNDPECGLYYESPIYVFSYLKQEIENGKYI